VLKETRYPISVLDELGRLVRYKTESDALAHLGPVRIINYHQPEYFIGNIVR
jgi:hypothetical protein